MLLPNGTTSPGPSRNVQPLSAARDAARSVAPGESSRRLTMPSTKTIPAAMKTLSMTRAVT